MIANCKFNNKQTITVKMLPHEDNLMFVNSDDSISKMSDVSMLMQAEKFANMYGRTYLQDTFGQAPKTSPLQEQLDNATDEVRMQAISSKYVQRPSEIKAESERILGAVQSIEDGLKREAKNQADQKAEQTTQQLSSNSE